MIGNCVNLSESAIRQRFDAEIPDLEKLLQSRLKFKNPADLRSGYINLGRSTWNRRGDGLLSDEKDPVKLTKEDTDKLEIWYDDICNLKGKKTPFWEWLKKDPFPGTNHQILGRFFNLNSTTDQAKLEYFLKVYMHQAAGDRANSENWYWRLAFLVGLAGLAVVLLVEFLQRVQPGGWDWLSWDWLSWFILVLFLMFVIAGFSIRRWGNEIYGKLKKRDEDKVLLKAKQRP